MTDDTKKTDIATKIIITLSAGLFLCSLFKEDYCTTNGCGDSIATFLFGWLGVVTGGAALTWLANPLLIISWFIAKRNLKYSLLFSFIATLLCFSFLLFDKVIDDEAGHYNKIIGYKLGYWLWTFSCSTMTLGNLYLLGIKKKRKTPANMGLGVMSAEGIHDPTSTI